ncbi:MFS transporter [Franzmannia qiaohouensis]|uniref:MFS transporter n=1 Tax=Franzmannia qiaohouensis TaxID=1329370 RepID=A0ABU1HFK0_9GAMM|nr:MFS transporter [Halomonas qiaohouensis]MDR5906246.1 MFS transporter [Halomonas qiaohouensis]
MMTAAQQLDQDPTGGYRRLVVVLLSPLAFALVFASWTIFAVLGVELKALLGFGEGHFALLLAAPMLIGALASLPTALLAQRFGGRRVMIACLLIICPFLWGLSHSRDYHHLLLAGAGLGLGAGSLAAGLVYVAGLCPRRHTGLALGLYGAGMLGAGLSYLLLPLVSQAYGWRVAPLIYLLPVLLVAALLWLFADDRDAAPNLTEEMSPSGQALLRRLTCWALWRLALVYSFFFGAFVALALWLPAYFSAQFQLPLKEAALAALPFTVAVGIGQVVGGAWADRRDFRALRWWVSAFTLVCLFLLSYPPFTMQVQGVHGVVAVRYEAPLWGLLLLLSLMGAAMGVGKGSLMRLLHRDHANEMPLVGGLALTLGGLFAALLPLMFVLGNEWIGIRTAGFMFLYASLVVCMLVMIWDHASGQSGAA